MYQKKTSTRFDAARDGLEDKRKQMLEKRAKNATKYLFEKMQPDLITDEGLELIRQDPDISRETYLKLMVTEEKYRFNPKYMDYLCNPDVDDLFHNAFVSGHEVGTIHLCMCVKDNLNQNYAELVGNYSHERRIPFIAGLRLISIYRSKQKLFYFVDPNRVVSWRPVRVNAE